MTISLEKAEIDLKPILEALNLLYPNFAVVFYRKYDSDKIKVISIISEPEYEAIFQSEDFVRHDQEIVEEDWHDQHYLLYKGGICQKDDYSASEWEKNFDLDADGNLVPKFKGFFEMLKDTSRKAKRRGLKAGIEKWKD